MLDQNLTRIPYLHSALAGQITVASDFVAKLQMNFGDFCFGEREIFCNMLDMMVGN